jgi:hypothetical protein
MNLSRRLSRHLSFANVVACLALFVALGGSAYAGSKINGNSIAKQSIGGGKLKNETITSKQVKKGSLNSSVIDMATLTTVPTAQTAVSAQSAGTANTASSAKTADSATTAATATKATSAETATKATNADHATSADSATDADHATNADTATTATHTESADDADTVDGETATELTDACPADTELFGGMCWEESVRPTASWIVASKECGDHGGRLPSVSELIAYVLREGIQVSGHVWSADVADASGAEELVVTSNETARGVSNAGSPHGYRCLFYRTNAG